MRKHKNHLASQISFVKEINKYALSSKNILNAVRIIASSGFFSKRKLLDALYYRTLKYGNLFDFVKYDTKNNRVNVAPCFKLTCSERTFRSWVKAESDRQYIKIIRINNRKNCYCLNLPKIAAETIPKIKKQESKNILKEVRDATAFLYFFPGETQLKGEGKKEMGQIEDIIKHAEERGRAALAKRNKKMQEKKQQQMEKGVSNPFAKLEDHFKESQSYSPGYKFFRTTIDKKKYRNFENEFEDKGKTAYRIAEMAMDNWTWLYSQLNTGKFIVESHINFEDVYKFRKKIQVLLERRYGKGAVVEEPLKQWVDEDGILHIGKYRFIQSKEALAEQGFLPKK